MTIFSKNLGGPWPLPGYAYGIHLYSYLADFASTQVAYE